MRKKADRRARAKARTSTRIAPVVFCVGNDATFVVGGKKGKTSQTLTQKLGHKLAFAAYAGLMLFGERQDDAP